jgi:hypothetical protein
MIVAGNVSEGDETGALGGSGSGMAISQLGGAL